MEWFILACFIVGVAFLMLFSEQGRGCLVVATGGVLGVVVIIIIGAVIIVGLIPFLCHLVVPPTKTTLKRFSRTTGA